LNRQDAKKSMMGKGKKDKNIIKLISFSNKEVGLKGFFLAALASWRFKCFMPLIP
jgi:hypothetical protein